MVDQLRTSRLSGLRTSSATGPSSVSALESGPIDDEAAYLPDDSSGVLRRILLAPGVVATMVLLVVAAIATRGLWWGEGVLQGGALLPVPEGARDVWASYTRAWHDVGPGSHTPSAPFLIVVGVVATVLFGNPDWAMNVLVLLAAPIAGWSAYVATRGMLTSKVIRAWMAVTYALLPAMTGAFAQGRVGTLITAIALPFAIRSGFRLSRRTGTIRRAVGTALLMSVILAATPRSGWWLGCTVIASLWPSFVGDLTVGDHAVRHRDIVPLLVLMPWTYT